MSKKQFVIGISTDGDFKKFVEEEAKKDDRTVSNFVARIVKEKLNYKEVVDEG